MQEKRKEKGFWKFGTDHRASHHWNINDPKVLEDIELSLKYRQVKKICRKCHNKLPTNENKCRNKKCHCTDLRFIHNAKIGGIYFYIPAKKVCELKKIKSD